MIVNDRYEVLTPSGFQDFKGLKEVNHNQYLRLIIGKNELECSLDHKLMNSDDIILAKDLNVGDILNNEIVKCVELINTPQNMFDLVEVNGNHTYFTNNIISHNCDCDFLTSGHTVVEGPTLQWYLENMCEDPIEMRGVNSDYWIWDYPNFSKQYMITVDVARGDGEDESTIEVFDVETLEQVAEWVGQIPPRQLGQMAVAVASEWNNGLLVIDNRNIGWDAVQAAIDMNYNNLYYSYKDDVYVDPIKHISKGYDLKSNRDKVPGFTTTNVNRPMMISKMEHYFMHKQIKVKSKRLINQLLVFVWLNGKPQARHGRRDDLVMATAMFAFIRDTSLKLKTLGIDMTKTALRNTYKKVYTAGKQRQNNEWEMRTGNGNTTHLKWLL